MSAEKPLIAVTGSAGKTMVKTMIASILREKWVVFESRDYYNTVDKTREHVHEISPIHRATVLEFGMAFPGAIAEHCRVLQPNIGVITNVGLAHIGNFEGRVQGLAQAKSELIRGMHADGLLFINGDDKPSELLQFDGFRGNILRVGLAPGRDYMAENIVQTEEGLSFSASLMGEPGSFFIPVFGRHNVYNALFAAGVSHQLGFTPSEIAAGLRNMKKPNHRLNILYLRDGIRVIDDTVHAHPPAMKAAIDVLSEQGEGKKIAVLGTMPELGMNSKVYHEEIGQYLAARKIDFICTYGGYSVNIGLGAIAVGFPPEKVFHWKVAQRKLLHKALTDLTTPGTTLLIKGASRLEMFETVRFLDDYYKME